VIDSFRRVGVSSVSGVVVSRVVLRFRSSFVLIPPLWSTREGLPKPPDPDEYNDAALVTVALDL
jgi:hypothetical protein